MPPRRSGEWQILFVTTAETKPYATALDFKNRDHNALTAAVRTPAHVLVEKGL